MALILPQNLPPPADPAAARLETTLASLPDEWTLLPGRRIGGADGPGVGFLLVHPEIGIALVDLAPARPSAAVAKLREMLAAEHLIADSDMLPIVAVTVDPDEIEAIGELLAETFDAAPPCDIADGAWPRRVIELLLSAEDAAMIPLPRRLQDTVASYEPEPEDGSAFAADEPMLLSAPARRHTVFAAICAAVIAVVGVGGAAAYLLAEGPAEPPLAATALSVPLPKPAQSPMPEIAQAPAPLPPAPLPPAPVSVDPRPAPHSLPAASGLAAGTASPAPAVAVAAPPQAVMPVPAEPAPLPPRPAPATMQSYAPPPPAARAEPVPVKTSPPPRKPAPKPVRKEVASTTNAAQSQAKPATKRVASLEPKPDRPAAPEASPARPTASSEDLPPIDASDLPALEGSTTMPSQTASLPVGAPVPLPTPFSGGAPAPGMPVMLLPPIEAPVAMPAAPAAGPGIGGLVGPSGQR